MDKIYQPETVPDTPFPQQDTTPTATTETRSGGSTSPPTTKNKNFPTRQVSTELLSSSLNTKSKKILQNFDLVEQGGMQIGKYENGLRGDIRITPAGITARNTSGVTTFAIDGDNGSAAFLGEVRAADFVIADNGGLVSLSNFRNGTVSASSSQNITSTSFVDLDSMILYTPNFSRETVLLIIFTAQNQIVEDPGLSDFNGAVTYVVNIDGVDDLTMYMTKQGTYNSATTDYSSTTYSTNSMHYLSTVSSGSHTIKIRWQVVNFAGTGKAYTFRRTLSFAAMGS